MRGVVSTSTPCYNTFSKLLYTLLSTVVEQERGGLTLLLALPCDSVSRSCRSVKKSDTSSPSILKSNRRHRDRRHTAFFSKPIEHIRHTSLSSYSYRSGTAGDNWIYHTSVCYCEGIGGPKSAAYKHSEVEPQLQTIPRPSRWTSANQRVVRNHASSLWWSCIPVRRDRSVSRP